VVAIVAGLLGFVAARASAHPVHASSTQVQMSGDGQALAIAVRFFTDDLEAALSASGANVSLVTSAPADVDTALSHYLAERIQVGIDGRALVRGRVSGHERDGDATLVFLTVPLRAAPVQLVILQRALLERFDDQTNLVHARIGDKKRSALLRRGNDRAEFDF
jgi:sensor domain CHASE-containing protein